MNVMVTGCCGFIGSHVVDEFLDAGYNVTGLDNMAYAANGNNINDASVHPNFDFVRADIEDRMFITHEIESKNIECIINLAAETHVDNSIKDSDIFFFTNVLGVKSLLDVCRDTGIKFFQYSTDEVYGVAKNKAFIERSTLNPTNPYSATKAAAEHIITAYANTYGVDYLMVRPSNNFGPRQHGEKFLPTIIRNLKAGSKIPIYGEGNQIREWTYVKDTAKATRFILENSHMNEVYNISSTFFLENIDLVKKVCDNMGKVFDESVEFVEDRLGHDFKYAVNSNKLNKLGFTVENNFERNLEETIEHLSEVYA